VFLDYLRFTGRAVSSLFAGLFGRSKLRVDATFEQLVLVGVLALPTVCLACFFMGLVLAMQGAYQLQQIGAVDLVADLVGVSMFREIGPLITAVVVIGRSGSSITAEIGTMKVSEEVEALEVMAIDPVRYLVVPRMLGMLIMVPTATILGECLGMFGGWLIAVGSLNIDPFMFVSRFLNAVVFKDIFSGLLKSLVFGGLIGTLACYYGMRVSGGAEGVGKATTQSVVTCLTAILATDCILTALFYFV
jgi:phospholipid/cholesterol/gamma-HCH transport system permease protein